MAVELKNSLNGGMDLDTSDFLLPKDRYRDALNITKDAVEGGQDNNITNIVSNQLIPYNYPEGTGIIIGSIAFPLRNTVIFFRYNSNGYNGIYEYNNDTKLITKIFECLTDSDTDILNFDVNGGIFDINIFPRDEGDLLFFLDTLGRPTTLNITRFKNGEYTPVTRQIIDVAKIPPPSPLTCLYGNDTSVISNGLVNKLFKFKTINVFDDFEQSTCSPISAVPLPVKILDDVYTNTITNNNVIYLSINSGDKNVKAIKLLMSYVNKTNNWSDFAVVDTIEKSSIGLTGDVSNINIGVSNLITITFGGFPSVGTIINIKVLRLSDSVILTAGTYTILAGDSLSNVVDALVISLMSSVYISAPMAFGTAALRFAISIFSYQFSELEIIKPGDSSNDNITFPYSFYNDGTYPIYDENRSIQLFDYVPDKAVSQELLNGNVLAYGGITEGYNKDLLPNVVNTILTVAAGGGAPIGYLNAVSVFVLNSLFEYPPHSGLFGVFTRYKTTFSGIPPVGTVINFKLTKISGGTVITASTYTTIGGDTSSSVATAIANNVTEPTSKFFKFSQTGSDFVYYMLTQDSFNAGYENFAGTSTLVEIEILPPAISGSTNSIATWAFLESPQIALQYYDQKGKTNGVLYNAKITFPPYAENGSHLVLLPYINSKIYHVPPIWAYSFQWLFTKNTSYFLYWGTSDVKRSDFHESDKYIYFDVTGITFNALKNPTVANVLNYEFVDGDRVRLIRRESDNTVYDYTYDTGIIGLVVNPIINNQPPSTGNFLKIRNVAPFAAVDYTSKNFVVQIYRPNFQSPTNPVTNKNETFFELGEEYPIINPTTIDRVHGGQVTQQDIVNNIPAEFNFYSGDAYFRSRTINSSESGFSTFDVQDRNFVDFYISAVNSISGRPSVIDANAKKTFFPAVIRFSQAYQPNTNINGFNQFYPENFFECDASFGTIQRMVVKERQLNIFQYFKTGFSPLFSEIRKDEVGNNILYQTDKLLNPIQYYLGEWGIGNARGSIAQFNYATYFCDTNKGAILRLSRDGIQCLSTLYKINSWTTQHIPLRVGDYKIFGAYDQKANNYIAALQATNNDPAYTLTFDEEGNSFESFLSLYPESMCTLGTLLISAKNGNIYTHDADSYNNFYGVQYPSSITPIFNKDPYLKKTFNAIGYQSNEIWVSPTKGDVITSNINPQTQLPTVSAIRSFDYDLQENVYVAALNFDMNSMANENVALYEGDFLKGTWIKVKLICPATVANKLVFLTMPYITNSVSNKNF